MAGQKILLGEGQDDEHVLKHICGNHGIGPLDEIKGLGGITNLLDHIPVRLKDRIEEGDVVGVVVDADMSLESRWQAVRERFVEAGYENVPADPDPNGTILEPPERSLLPRAGVWIMPDNRNSGILEDFLRFLVPQSNELFDHVTKSVDSIPVRLFKENDEPKAVIHTWLAWQKEPGTPYGTAITARFLRPDVPQVDDLVSWLRRLFYSQ